MRFVIAWLAALVIVAGSAAFVPSDVASPVASVAAAQAPGGLDVDVTVTEQRGGAWWTDPVWIAIGVIGLVLLIVVVAMAARGGGTTVVKD